VDETYSLNLPGLDGQAQGGPPEDADPAGYALAEAVLTCRALEDHVDTLAGMIRDLVIVVSDLQDRLEELEDPVAAA
jgi:hypothetical protein